jgi:hypothetical protein
LNTFIRRFAHQSEPEQPDVLLGSPVYLPTSAMEALPVLNETCFIRNGCRVVVHKRRSDGQLGMSCTSGLIVQRPPTSLC